MSAPPYFPLYTADFMADTAGMTPVEVGAYALLLVVMWRNGGSLADDDRALARYARLTSAQWARSRSVVSRLFEVSSGVWRSPSLEPHLTKYANAVEQRRLAGSNGGKAKALKDKENTLAAASLSPWQSESEPELEKNASGDKSPSVSTSTPLAPTPPPAEQRLPLAADDGASGSGAGAQPTDLADRRNAAKRHLDETVDAIWMAQPKLGGKRRATRPDVRRKLLSAVKRGGKPDEIRRACLAYYALPESRKEGGQFAMGAARLLEDDRWKEFLSAEPTIVRPVNAWTGPPEFRAEVVAATSEAWAVSYLGDCRWAAGDPPSLIAKYAIVADRIKAEIPLTIRKFGVRVVHAPAEARREAA